MKRKAIKKYQRRLNRLQVLNTKMICAFDWVTDVNGKAQIYINMNGRFLNTLRNFLAWGGTTAATGANNWVYPKEAINYVALYHSMRIAMVKLRFIPHYTEASAAGSGNNQNLPVWYFYDKEGIEWIPSGTSSTPASIDNIIQQENYKAKQSSRPWKIIVRSLKYPMQSKYTTIETATPVNIQNHAGVWHGAESSIGDMEHANSAHAVLYTEGHNTGKILGKVIVTVYAQFKDRKQIS